MRKSTKQTIAVSIGILVVLSVVFFLVYNIQKVQIKKEYEARLSAKESVLQQKKRIVYVPKKDIKAGYIINQRNVEKTLYYSDTEQSEFFADEDLGKTALITVKKDQPILKSMITKNVVGTTVREQEFTEINLATNLKRGDQVDIRIVYPNGESYVVLSKMLLKQLATDNSGCYLDLNAEELDRIQGAFVDAYVNKATLYTVKYVQPTLQTASKITYTPPVQVIDLIENDPNIIAISSEYLSETARNNLESRLKVFRDALANRELEEKQQEKKLLDLTNGTDGTDENEENDTSLEDDTDTEDELVYEEENEEGVDFLD